MEGRFSKARVYLMAICIFISALTGCAAIDTQSDESKRIPITIYKSAAIDIRSRNIEKIAVAEFDSRMKGKKHPGTRASEYLAKALSDTFIYSVKGPNEVSSDLLINGLGIKPFMEKSELRKVGQALKVDAFFLGEVKKREIVDKVFSKVVTEKEETGDGEFVKDDSGKLHYQQKTKDVNIDMECKTGTGEIVIRYKLYDAKTGNLIFDRVESLSEEVDAFCYRANITPAKMTTDEIESLLDEVTEELSNKFVVQLTPPSKTELVIFENIPGADTFSKNLLAIGIDYAKVGDWPKAIESFKKSRDKNRNKSEAHYNLGIAYEGYGWHEKALLELQAAQKRNPKKLYSDAIRKVKKMAKKGRENTE